MDAILAIGAQYNLSIIEDAAQAIGAESMGRRAGSMGDVGCFSFFPSKNLGAFGDGGMVVTNNEALGARVKLLRGHGAQPKYFHKAVGGNFRLDALQAAVLRVKLARLDTWTEARCRNADHYRALFTQAGLTVEQDGPITLPKDAGQGRHIYNQFVIRLEQRDALMAHLQALRIGCEIYYPGPLHLQECFVELGYRPGDLPHSEAAAQQTLAIPIYPELSTGQQETVVGAIRDFFKPTAPLL